MTTALSQVTTIDPRLGFQSQEEEMAVDRLPVTGSLPDWLTGALVRVTPAKLEVGGERLGHWFDGLATLNRFAFTEGEVSYRSRFLDTRAYRAAREGRRAGAGFGTDPCRSIFQRVQSVFSPDLTDNANVNLVRIGQRHIAMTETPLPIEFDSETLATRGPLEFEDRTGGQITTAHPHYDRERNEMVNYSAKLSRKSEYRLWGLPAGSNSRRQIASLPVDEPAYMHAFGMSERYLILAEYPLRVNPLRLAFSGKAFIKNYRWKPELGTRFTVIDRATGSLRGRYETDAFFSFHHVNAFERGQQLVVDLLAYEDPSIIDALYLDEDGPVGTLPPVELRRYTIGLDSGRVDSEPLAEGNLELPRIDYGRRNTRDYTYAYFAGSDGGWLDRLVKVDTGRGAVASWSEDGCYPGEPIFVRRPGADGEDSGVILSVVLDARSERSFLLVLDAEGFQELARAEAPHHIPFGFHGQYLP
ncbi:MAG: carotenoid oxygenase family protein [Thermoleophilaceae bacterium]|nr:carotenoid oxygenase family protein [Thermoleophilaceae bacterium]